MSTRSTAPPRSPPATGSTRSTPSGSGSPGPTTAGGSTRTAPAPGSPRWRASGSRWPGGQADVRATPYTTTITHTRRTPFRRTFRHRSHLWVVDLDRLPETAGWRGSAGGSPRATTSTVARPRSARASTHTSLTTGVDVRGGRVLMAAHPRALGHCFNPITVFWCWRDQDAAGPADATVVEVHNTYGDRHAYLVPTDARVPDGSTRRCTSRPSTPPTATTRWWRPHPTRPGTSPSRSRSALTRAAASPPPSSASRRSGHRSSPSPPLRGALLIRMHGIVLWLRGLPVRPRPEHLEGPR